MCSTGVVVDVCVCVVHVVCSGWCRAIHDHGFVGACWCMVVLCVWLCCAVCMVVLGVCPRHVHAGIVACAAVGGCDVTCCGCSVWHVTVGCIVWHGAVDMHDAVGWPAALARIHWVWQFG